MRTGSLLNRWTICLTRPAWKPVATTTSLAPAAARDSSCHSSAVLSPSGSAHFGWFSVSGRSRLPWPALKRITFIDSPFSLRFRYEAKRAATLRETRWSFNRWASARMVRVGFAQPPVGNTELPATYRFE